MSAHWPVFQTYSRHLSKNYRAVVLHFGSTTGWKLEEFPRNTLPVSLFQVNFPLGSFMVFVRMSCVRCPTTMLYTDVPNPTLSRRWIVLPELTNHKLLLSGKETNTNALQYMYFDKLYLPFYFLQKTLSNSPNKENKELVIIHFYGKYLSLRFVFLEKKVFHAEILFFLWHCTHHSLA